MNGLEPARESFKTHSRATFGQTDKIIAKAIERHGEVIVVKVNSDVWARALRLAKGDANRIDILSETEVVVRNKRVR